MGRPRGVIVGSGPGMEPLIEAFDVTLPAFCLFSV